MAAKFRLTALAAGGGCGCKIAPAPLRALLAQAGVFGQKIPARLLAGAAHSEDAAVWKIAPDRVVAASTDFFAPPVDNPRDFGRIAAANALSDLYAGGARPLFALCLLAAPMKKLPHGAAAKIVGGAAAVCQQAGAVIAGGHSIEAAEPIFGLAAVGEAHPKFFKTNGGARPGDALLLTKPLGAGLLAAAHKKGALPAAALAGFVRTATQLNCIGLHFAKNPAVRAMTDVTGFGLLGHLREMCTASNTRAVIHFSRLPFLAAAARLAKDGEAAGAARRNWASYRAAVDIDFKSGAMKLPRTFGGPENWPRALLCDPQTGGGLLVAVKKSAAQKALAAARRAGFKQAALIGEMTSGGKSSRQICVLP